MSRFRDTHPVSVKGQLFSNKIVLHALPLGGFGKGVLCQPCYATANMNITNIMNIIYICIFCVYISCVYAHSLLYIYTIHHPSCANPS